MASNFLGNLKDFFIKIHSSVLNNRNSAKVSVQFPWLGLVCCTQILLAELQMKYVTANQTPGHRATCW